MGLKFHILDVFTDQAFKGNQLAIVEEADELSSETMLAITREFGFSETVFLQSSDNPTAVSKLRIFTPKGEISFAGHPTIGTAVLLGLQKAKEQNCGQDVLLILDEEVGPVRSVVSVSSEKSAYAEIDVPQLPKVIEHVPEIDLVADALGLDIQDVGFENHKIMSAEIGIRFVYVPLKNRSLVSKAAPNFAFWSAAFSKDNPVGVFVYCRGGEAASTGFHGRMFAPDFGISEDAATGGAVVGFSRLIERFEIDAQSHYETMISQGFEMGRDSFLKLELELENRALRQVRLGGDALLVASGELN